VSASPRTVFLVVLFLSLQTMELAGNAVRDNKNQIMQRHIQLVVRMQKMIGTVEHCYFIKMETIGAYKHYSEFFQV
jgi:hypothetical protein